MINELREVACGFGCLVYEEQGFYQFHSLDKSLLLDCLQFIDVDLGYFIVGNLFFENGTHKANIFLTV